MSDKKHDGRAVAGRVAYLTLAEADFGNAESVRRWLSKPKKQLNGLSPNEAMRDEHGAALVEQLLKRIDNGYF